MDAENVHVFLRADLSRIEGAAGDRALAVGLENEHGNESVGDEDVTVGPDLLGKFFPAERYAARHSLASRLGRTCGDRLAVVVGHQEDFTFDDVDLAVVRHEPGADLGALRVEKDRAGDTRQPRGLADAFHAGLVVLMVAVGEIEAGHVHPRAEKVADDPERLRRRPHRTHYFCFSGKHIYPFSALFGQPEHLFYH